jgi:hypothetical protein
MKPDRALAELVRAWSAYLERRGHRVRQALAARRVLVSRNGQGRRYRWLLFRSRLDVRGLTRADHRHVKQQLGRGRQARERVFVVVQFDPPISRLVAMPARNALVLGQISSARGGIPWEGQDRP